MTAEFLLLVLGMTVVTLVPRVLPALLPPGLRIPDAMARWLDNVPYAALGALIFPGILHADPQGATVGIAAGTAAAGVALLRAPAFVAALVAVAAAVAVKFA